MLELDDARRDALVETWAQQIVARGLGTAAVFLLEAHKPIGPLGAQALLALRPLLNVIMHANLAELAAFMNRPDNIEQLIRRVEQLDEERRTRGGGCG